MPKENSEFVTLAILKEMLAAQERAYKTTTQLLVDDMRSEIRSLRSEVDELKESVKFTSAKYEELKEKSQKVDSSSLVSGIKVPNESACAAFQSHSVS